MRRFVYTVTAVLVALALPRIAGAQVDTGSADVAAARTLGVEGFRLAAAGNCGDAVDRLTRSEALHHAVSVLEKLGECQVKLGRLVDGTESLRRVTHEELAPTAPAAFLTARAQAQVVLDEAGRRIAHVNITVSGAPSSALWVKVDGVPVPAASLNTDRAVDPGEHVIEAGAAGFAPVTTKVVSKDGATDPVTLTLVPEVLLAAAPAPAPVVVAPAPVIEAPVVVPPARRSHTAAYVVGAIGVAGLVVGAVGGVVALNDKSTLDGSCHAGICPPTAASTLTAGKTVGTVSTVGFIAGGVGVAACVSLYFIGFGGPEQAGPRARAYLAPGSVGVSGTF